MALSCMLAFEKQGPGRTKTRHVCIGVQIHYVGETLEGNVNLLCLQLDTTRLPMLKHACPECEPSMQTWNLMQGGHRLGRKAAHSRYATILAVLEK